MDEQRRDDLRIRYPYLAAWEARRHSGPDEAWEAAMLDLAACYDAPARAIFLGDHGHWVTVDEVPAAEVAADLWRRVTESHGVRAAGPAPQGVARAMAAGLGR